MATYGYERLVGLVQEDLEARLHEMLNRKDADGNPAPATVDDLRQVIDALLDGVGQLDGWVQRNAG